MAPYREMYFYTYPIGLISYKWWLGIITFVMSWMLMGYVRGWLGIIYVALYVTSIVIDRKYRSNTCGYYRKYMPSKFSSWISGSGNVPEQNTNILIFSAFLSLVVFIAPIISPFYIIFFEYRGLFEPIALIVYLGISLIPITQIKKDFSNELCEW